jgi:N-formylmaleamate deformylase
VSAWSTGICKTNGIGLHYTRTGGNGLPVVLLHGLTANGACWTLLARELERDCDVIMPDARGHGKSSVPEVGYGYGDQAQDVVGLIQTLSLPAPVLIGHSMGGMTAAVVAGQNPRRLRGLVLADPSFLRPQVQHEVRESDVADQHRRMLTMSLDEIVAEARARHPQRSPELLELLARARLQTSLRAFEVLKQPYPDYWQLVRSIDVPTLLVIGEQGVVSSELAVELQGANPKIQVQKISNVGHGLHYDQPERFAAIVRAFLGSLGAAMESHMA